MKIDKFIGTEDEFIFTHKSKIKAGFDPNQSRRGDGQWGSGSWHKIDVKQQVTNHLKYTGSTYDPITGKDLGYSETELYSVSINPELTFNPDKLGKNLTENMLNSFLNENKDVFLEGGKAVGSWYGADAGGTDELWLDVVTLVTNREAAIKLGQKHNQVSIFDLKNMKEIKTGGTGKSEISSTETKQKDKGWENWGNYMREVIRNRSKK